jgi:hypothetical protein
MADEGDESASPTAPDPYFDELPIPQIDVLPTDVTDITGESELQYRWRDVWLLRLC